VERRFSAFLAGHYLTYNHLLEQLVRRYDREIVKGQRSALRKILNKDAAPSIPVILCVAQIKQSEASVPESSTPLTLELTDGWYSVEARLDTCLREMVRSGKIQPGTKIMTCDAKLEGLEEGLDPLDTNYCPIGGSNGCSLLLAANGTRLAKWNAKLGFVAPTKKTDAQGGKVLTRRISDIIPGGGNVPLIDLVVSRRYPKLFLEQPANGERKLQPLSKSNNVLTEAENWARCKNFDSEKENMIEKVLEEVRQECEKVSHHHLALMSTLYCRLMLELLRQDIDEIAPAAWRLIAQSESPEKLYRRLDDLGKSSVDGWNRKRAALLQRSIQKAISERIAEDDASTRKITPFLRLLVKSTDCKKSLKCEEAVLTVWQPTDDQLDVLQEGSILRFRELSVRPDRYDGMLQFTASSRTSMEMRTQAVPCNDENGYVPRTPTNLFSVTCASKRLLQTVQASGRPVETDTLGIVFKVFDNKHDADGCVYVTDESGLVLRIQRISLFSDFDTESRFISTATESKREAIVACRDLRVLPYDTSEVCAVAEYTRTSSHSTGSKNARVNQLMSWACTKEGRAKLRYLAACVDAEVPFLQKPAMLDERVAFGYVAGFFVPPSKVLQVTVDCTGDQLHTWNFPLSLLKETSEACQGSVVALNADAEASASQLKCLGDISRARGILLRFHLRRVKSTDTLDGFIYEVFSVKKANIGALASLNITLLESVKPNT
jgi:breast cancer 2 susceptibility protein